MNSSMRFDGSLDGSGAPRIVWKSTPKQSGDVTAFKPVDAAEERAKLEAAFDYPGYLGRDRSACMDIATGDRKWKDGRYGHGQLFLVDDLLVVQTAQGPIALAEANPAEYREVARLSGLNAKTWNTPALAGEFLLVRNDQKAVCYQLPKRTAQMSERASLEGN